MSCPTPGCGGVVIGYVYVHSDGSQSPGYQCLKCGWETH